MGAELKIPRSCRVGNPDGRCFGAALEDCARYMHMKSLYGISACFAGGTNYSWDWMPDGTRRITYCDVDRVLSARGWKKPQNWDETWSGDPAWLEKRLKAGFPCVVSVWGGHGECLRKLTKTQAIIVDNDGCWDPWRGHYWANSDHKISRQRFLQLWQVQGWAVVLYQEPRPKAKRDPVLDALNDPNNAWGRAMTERARALQKETKK